ncbi:MAG: FAD binding domain-containing protein [Rectinemataceae bacterium]|jgi:probable selenate reductase FAD-binding subunit
MISVQRFMKASSPEEALAAKRADPSASYLAGGTLLLAGDGRDKPEAVIDLGQSLPKLVVIEGGTLSMGAGACFQELAESKDLPPCLVEAALSMVNRNTRNRATLGGNLGADKSCSSLIPILIALGAEIEVVSPSSPMPKRLELEAWLRDREVSSSTGSRASDLVLRVLVPLRAGRRAAYRRWNRVSCDLSVLGAAAAFDLEGGRVRNLRLALGGLGPKARRFPEIEALFEGSPLPSREKMESAVSPLLKPIDDLRASAAFKRLRGAQLVADALRDAAATRGISEDRT